MNKVTFTPGGRPDKSTSCFHNKNAKMYGKTKAFDLVIITVRASIQTSEITSFFSRKMLQENPNV